MLCQLSYRGKQPWIVAAALGGKDAAGAGRRTRHASARRRSLGIPRSGRRRRAGRERGEPADRGPPGRAARAWAESRPGRRRARAADPPRAPLLPAEARARLRREDGPQDEACARIARAAAPRPAATRRRCRRVGRCGARVPAPAPRAPGAGDRRAVRCRDRRGSPPLPAKPFARPGRDRRAEHISRAHGPRQPSSRPGSRARRAPGRELLLDRRALPRQPVAAGAPKPSLPDAGHRPEPAARPSEGCSARPAGRDGAARQPRRDSRRDRPLVALLRRRPAARPRARVDGVRVPAGRGLERRRARGDAAAPRDVGVRRHRPARVPDAAHVRRERPRRRQVPPLAARRVRRERAARARGWYQGARAVRERGLYRETKEFVRIVLALYGTV